MINHTAAATENYPKSGLPWQDKKNTIAEVRDATYLYIIYIHTTICGKYKHLLSTRIIAHFSYFTLYYTVYTKHVPTNDPFKLHSNIVGREFFGI